MCGTFLSKSAQCRGTVGEKTKNLTFLRIIMYFQNIYDLIFLSFSILTLLLQREFFNERRYFYG